MSKENQRENSERSEIEELRVEVYDPNLGEGGKWDDICTRQVAILYLGDNGLAVKGNIDNPFVMEWFIRALAGKMSTNEGVYSSIVGKAVLDCLNDISEKYGAKDD